MFTSKQQLEKFQVLIYSAAIFIGLFFGNIFPGLNHLFELLLWPVLGLLLYTTFTQVPLSNLKTSFTDWRFISSAIIGNFLLIPLIVWGLISFLPDQLDIRLGVALVLLVPCTDWFITFTQLGKGDTGRAIAFAPISLLFQIVLLPIYLFIFFGSELTLYLATNQMLLAFTGIILLPLFLAYLTEKWVRADSPRKLLISRLGWFPIPILGVVIFMIAASQSAMIREATAELIYPAVIFIVFLLIAALLAKLLSSINSLSVLQARVLAFSFSSRNSFVVLPVALALPESFEITVIIIVLQSLIELFGMAIFVWFIPKVLFRIE